jgi:hypothetical protein
VHIELVATCTDDSISDGLLADRLEGEDLGFTRVGNNFVVNNPAFRCGDNDESLFKSSCEGLIGGVETCTGPL